jgi:hypothetical protein
LGGSNACLRFWDSKVLQVASEIRVRIRESDYLADYFNIERKRHCNQGR